MNKVTRKLVNTVKHHDLVHIEVIIDLRSIIFTVDDGKVFIDKAQRKVLKDHGLTEEVANAVEAAVRARWIHGEMPQFDLRPVLKLNKPAGDT